MALTEGTDLPHVDCIVIGRHTASESTIIQMIGRGLRTHEEKEDCLVLEYTGRSDMNEIIHYWRLDSPEPEQEKAKRERGKSNTAVELESMVTQFPRQISQMDQTRVQYPWFRPFGDRPLMAFPLWSQEGEAGRYITVEPLRRGGWRVFTIILLNRGPAPVMREQSTLERADDAAIRVRMALGRMAPLLRRQAPWRQKPASPSQLRTWRQLNLEKTQDPQDQGEITAGRYGTAYPGKGSGAGSDKQLCRRGSGRRGSGKTGDGREQEYESNNSTGIEPNDHAAGSPAGPHPARMRAIRAGKPAGGPHNCNPNGVEPGRAQAHRLQQRRDHDNGTDPGYNRRIHGGEPMGSDRPHDGRGTPGELSTDAFLRPPLSCVEEHRDLLKVMPAPPVEKLIACSKASAAGGLPQDWSQIEPDEREARARRSVGLLFWSLDPPTLMSVMIAQRKGLDVSVRTNPAFAIFAAKYNVCEEESSRFVTELAQAKTPEQMAEIWLRAEGGLSACSDTVTATLFDRREP